MTGTMPSVALINPPDPVRGADPAEQGPPPLGLCSIAAYLRAAGVRCDLFDLCAVGGGRSGLDDLVPTGLLDHDVFGITAYTKTIGAAIDVARWVKARRPGATVVLGGPHATPCATELLVAEPAVDFVIRNDGEEPFACSPRSWRRARPTWAPSRRSPGGPRHVRGWASGATPGSRRPWPSTTSRRRPATSWSSPSATPPSGAEPGGPAPTAFISTSRGRPKRCSFCSIIVMNPRWRFRSVDNVIAELRDLDSGRPLRARRHPRRQLLRARRPGAGLRRRHRRLAARAHLVGHGHGRQDPRQPRRGRRDRPPVRIPQIGIDSGSDSVLARMGKRTTVADNRAAIELLRANGIRLDLDFIMFDPWTTVPELVENLEFLRDTELLGYLPADPIFNAVRIYPGTEVHDRCVAELGLRATHDMDVRPPFVVPEVAVIHGAISRWRGTYLKEIQALVPRPRERGRDTGLDDAAVALAVRPAAPPPVPPGRGAPRR